MKHFSFIKFTIGIILGLTLASLISFNVILIWVATGPRSLEKFTPYLERALTGESGVNAKIGKTLLLWDGWQNPLDLRLREVELLNDNNEIFAKFPEISLGLDVVSLAFGNILPTSISVTKPLINIRQEDIISLGLENNKLFSENKNQDSSERKITTTAETLEALIEALINPRSKSSLRKLRLIECIDADFSILNSENIAVISAPNSNLIISKESSSDIKASLQSVINYHNNKTPLEGKFAYNKRNKRLEGNVSVSKINPAELAKIMLKDHWLLGIDFPISGKIGFAFANNGKLDALQFSVTGGKGKISNSHLAGELPIKNLQLKGKASSGLSLVNIENLQANIADGNLSAKSLVNFSEKGIGIKGEAAIKNVTTDDIALFWPPELAPISREWIIANIKNGKIDNASAVVSIKSGDLALPTLPREAIKANIVLRNAKIRYLDSHPEIKDVDADIAIDGISLDAKISKATAFSDTLLSSGRVVIADLNPNNPFIEISMHADSAASDVATLLGLPMLEHAKRLNIEAAKTKGRAVGEAKIGLYFFARDENGNETPITYDVKANLSQVSSPAFLNRFDIENANGELLVNPEFISYKGSAYVNKISLTNGDFVYDMSGKNSIDTVVRARLSLDNDALERFGINLPVSIGKAQIVDASLSLATKKPAVSIPEFKVTGISNSVNHDSNNYSNNESSSQDKSKINLSGNAEFSDDGKDVASLKLNKVQYSKTLLSSLEYKKSSEGATLKLAGKSFDLIDTLTPEENLNDSKNNANNDSQVKEIDKINENNFSFANFPDLNLEADIEHVYGAYGQELQNVKAELKCHKRCTSAAINGDIGDNKFTFSIKPEGKNRKISVSSLDAGRLLRALGITNSMEGGALSISGQFQDNLPASQLRGELLIRDYTLKNTPVLAKILSLASLTGFFDTLSGNGIGFKKLSGNFTLQNDIITIKEGRSYGSAMGITADGTIAFPARKLHIEGTIVPSYSLNNVVGKVPLVGDILTGGEGQGVFAVRYSVKGDSEQPEIMVNPLSVLTPGFLRNLFDIF